MARKAKTAAEREAERKRREAEWWNKVILFYLNQMYHEEVDRQVEKYRPKLLVEQMAQYIREKRVLDKLREKKPGQLSALELLKKMQVYQEEDSPFRSLYQDIQDSPDAEEKIAEALGRCVEEAPKRILGRGRRKAVHVRVKAEPEAEEPGEEPQDREKAREEAERLNYEMAFLRTVMPPQLYRELCQRLIEQGRMRDPVRDAALTSVRDALRAGAEGKSAAYHKLVNALDRFVSVPEEPTKKEKEALAMGLAQYVMTEGDPKDPAYQREAVLQAARGLQALVPEEEFRVFLRTANAKRRTAEKITPEKLAALAAQAPQAVERDGPAMAVAGT